MGAIAFIGVPVFGLLSTFFGFKIIDKVNQKLEQKIKFHPLGWQPAKYTLLEREYKRLYPQGHLLKRRRTLALCMITSFVVSILCFTFSRH